MKIAINSPDFLPKMGGLANMTALIAGYFARQGNEVRVLTITPADVSGEPDVGYQIVRDPKGSRLWETAKWCDVFVHSNMSLKAVHPLLLLRKPWIAIHHGWYSHPERPKNLNALAKCALARLASANIAVSHAVADYLGIPCRVILNPYNQAVFREYPDTPRSHDLLFVGRLVSDKAPHLLIEALGRLSREGIEPLVTITGEGPEEHMLRARVAELGLSRTVQFTGAQSGETLARTMNAHRILVVPSTVREGLPLVVLEGIACGCVVVGADAGGLPEAVGSCGLIFPRGDVSELTTHVRKLLTDPRLLDSLRSSRQTQLESHDLKSVGDSYLEILRQAARR